ncbi:MAG: recombinase family protein [Candidatus Moduliflexus flocculans]|nr:recombinase family protein [Candidatus Moduliflexus flocculans]
MIEQRAAIYARYSDREQDGSSTIESQIRECRTYARAHGFTIVENAIFIDRARTGTTTEQREAFQTMIAAAQRTPRPFDVILIWKFSRFARNREDSALYKGLLRRRGVRVLSSSEPVDEHSATGVLTEAMIEAIDAFYSARLAEEVKARTNADGLGRLFHRREAPVRIPAPRSPGCARPSQSLRRADRTSHAGDRARRGRRRGSDFRVVRGRLGLYAHRQNFERRGHPRPSRRHVGPSTIRELLKNDAYHGARAYGRVRKIRTATGTRSKRNRPREEWTVQGRDPSGDHPRGPLGTGPTPPGRHRRGAAGRRAYWASRAARRRGTCSPTS